MAHTKKNRDPELWKTKTKVDEIKEMKYKAKKPDYEKILKTSRLTMIFIEQK